MTGEALRGTSQALSERLWADIARAKAELNSQSAESSLPSPLSDAQDETCPEESVRKSTRNVLSLILPSHPIKSLLDQRKIGDRSVLGLLADIGAQGRLDPGIASALADEVLAAATICKPSTRGVSSGAEHSTSIASSKMRVKGPSLLDGRPISGPPLLEQVIDAISEVRGALSAAGDMPIANAVVGALRSPLHQIFLFVATSAVGLPSSEMTILREISGLIQVLGVLAGMMITSPSLVSPLARTHQVVYNSGTPLPIHRLQNIQSNFPDIGTAVYPCLYPGCGKTFSRLLPLRNHEAVHSIDRPFKCNLCSSEFARKHDLKRHGLSHNANVFRCNGCHRTFTRKDALTRHQANPKSTEACLQGGCEEVIGDVSVILASNRRVKSFDPSVVDDIEEGELPKLHITLAQNSVRELYPLLQKAVYSKLSESGEVPRPGELSVAHPPILASKHPTPAFLLGYDLNPEQTSLLEKAIAAASETARIQAELEAQLELAETA